MIPALGAIDSKIVDKMTSKYATKLLDDAVAANEGNPLTGEQINRLLIGAKNSLMQKFKVGGVKAVKGFLEGGAIGGLGYAGQVATNKLSNEIAGKRVYTTDDFNTGDALNEMLKQGMDLRCYRGEC